MRARSLKRRMMINVTDNWIRVGNTDYYLKSDRCCWTVARRVKRDPARNKGVDHAYVEQTYHGNIRQAAEELLDRKAKEAPVETLSDIVRAYRDAHEWIKRELGFVEVACERAA
jgi:hypothetical protein